MKYLVCINGEGVQSKFHLGKDPEKIEKELKKIRINHARIIFLFNTGKNPLEKGRWSNDLNNLEYKRDVDELYSNMRSLKAKEFGAFPPELYSGYDMRKRVLGKYIEVIVEMDEKNFNKAFSGGLDGAIEILSNTVKLMHPSSVKDPGEEIAKWMRILEDSK